jgi:DNA-binding NarL/FixJ family response regulator
MIEVLLADDEELIRMGLARIIDAQPDMTIVAEVSDGEEAVDVAERLRPDVVLMDVRMPRLDGLRATQRLHARGIRTQILVLTTFDSDDYVYRSLRAGAAGFLLKRTSSEELLRAIRVVADGDAIIEPSVTKRLIDKFAQPGIEPIDLAEQYGLTDREIGVLSELATGASNADIAKRLNVSAHTVKSHVSHVLGKIGCETRVQAVVFAFDTGLAMPHPEHPDNGA